MTKEEKKAYNKAYRAANGERLRAEKNAQRAADPEAARAREKAYRELKAAQIRARKKADYAANAEKIKERARQRRKLNSVKYREADKARLRADPIKFREARRRRTYGVSVEEQRSFLEAHGNACAICGAPDTYGRGKGLAFDHDHVTGELRGVLCINCNTAIGLMKDSPLRLRAAAAYLDARQPKLFKAA